jgi:hypothetical protein
MTSAERRHKFMASTPVLALMFGVPTGVIMGDLGSGPFNWEAFLFIGIAGGIAWAIMMKRQLSKLPGVLRTSDDWLLLDYFKKGALPKEPKLLKAMPEFLDRNELNTSQSKKSLPVMFLLGIGCILYGNSLRSALMLAGGLLLMGEGIYFIFSTRKADRTRKELRKQLQSKMPHSK